MKRPLPIFLSLVLYALFFQACGAQSQLISDEIETVSVEKLKYYLYFPQDYEMDKDKEFGLLLFLHGGGDAGDSLSRIKSSGPPKLIADGKQFPFLILAPQHPHERQWWNTRSVMQLLDTIVAHNRVDKKRIYLTGLSRGGNAAWELAVHYPKKFAAMAVVCGMAPAPYAKWIDKEMPIWVFHGEEDKSIPISESEEMVARLQKLGHKVQFTRYPGVGHNSWVRAYNTEALYDWFAAQQRKD